ncbi:MAG: rod shape-determining protein MreD [Fibrobacter sp.]|nr:rod shape-determining protein MreD [Fibrobacter sp.]
MIKIVVKWIVFFTLGFILQTTVVPVISVFGVKPDLLVLILFLLATKTGLTPAIYTGFFLGLAQDLYSPSILGQNALSKTVAGSFAGLFNEKVMRIDPLLQGILLLITFFLNDFVYYIVQVAKTDVTMKLLGMELLVTTLPRALYSLVLAIIPLVWSLYSQTSTKR